MAFMVASGDEKLRISSTGQLTTFGNNNGNPVGLQIRNNNTAAYSHAQLTLTSQNATSSNIWCDVPNSGLRLQYDGGTSVKVNSSGNLVMASGSGIDFSATANSNGSMGSELLDDYEEGTFTPIFYYVSGTSGVTYSVQEGRYTKIGRMVSFQIRMALTNKGSGNYNARIGGLPFTPQAAGVNYDHFMFSAIVGMNLGATTRVPFAQMEDYSVGRITLYSFDYGSGTNYNTIDSSVIGNTLTFGLQGVYITAS